MPILNFTNPIYLIAAIVIFVLCIYLARNFKTNTVPCIMLLAFLTILVVHVVELTQANSADVVSVLAKNIVIDEAFTFVSFLSFLWLDKIQVETRAKGKKSDKTKLEDKTVKDGLDLLWKKV